jgi:hypothetical protein
MRLKIRWDGWKRKYFGFAWQLNRARVYNTGKKKKSVPGDKYEISEILGQI